MNQTIIEAIEGVRLLSLTYKGIDRIVEPHAYGTSNVGSELLRCYQVEGDHTSDKWHDWELLTVSKISNMSLHTSCFEGTRPDYKRNDKAMATIHAQL
jgi:hypothetical protein